MRSSYLLLVVGAAALVLVVFAVLAPGLVYDPEVWYGIGAVYVLTLALAVGLWYRLNRPLEFPETIAVATVVVAGVVSLTVTVFQGTSPDFPSLAPFLVQWLLPAAFMLPLGAAATRRQRIGTVGIMLLPALYLWVDFVVLRPSGFFAMSPVTAAALHVWWSLSSAATGVPLLLVGSVLAREGGSLRDTVRRRSAPETG